jgi:hypothetical protein
MAVRSPRVEFLWWEGCPSWDRALDELRQAMEGVGLDAGDIEVIEIETEAEAEGRQFVGSPTIRIDGADLQPTGEEPAGLTCRIYRLRDGRVSPLPDPADLRDALAAASTKGAP